jgi:hypothetical protein
MRHPRYGVVCLGGWRVRREALEDRLMVRLALHG